MVIFYTALLFPLSCKNVSESFKKIYMIFQVFYFKLYIYFIFLPIEHPYSSDGLAGGILNMVFSYQDSAEKK